MIISHTHRYVFVELPMTGSTAISRELCENYDGISILQKHATYYDFLKVANAAEQTYFVLAGMRNPLDQVVSHYFKFKTDHHQQFTSDKNLKIHQKSWRHRLAYDYSHLRRFRFIQETDANFASFFLQFYKVPYNNWSSMAHDRFDFIIRFESLADDFAQAIAAMGLGLKRPLPSQNKTAEKAENFYSYYDTPAVQVRAGYVFGPFLRKWGYALPTEWGDTSPKWSAQAQFHVANVFRNIYWRYLRQPAVAKNSVSLEESRQQQLASMSL